MRGKFSGPISPLTPPTPIPTLHQLLVFPSPFYSRIFLFLFSSFRMVGEEGRGKKEIFSLHFPSLLRMCVSLASILPLPHTPSFLLPLSHTSSRPLPLSPPLPLSISPPYPSPHLSSLSLSPSFLLYFFLSPLHLFSLTLALTPLLLKHKHRCLIYPWELSLGSRRARGRKGEGGEEERE